MIFKNLTYAKLNLTFDVDAFVEEYDKKVLPYAVLAGNGLVGVEATRYLNSIWGMVPNEEYGKINHFVQEGDAFTYTFVERERPSWRMYNLMRLDTTGITDPHLLKFGPRGIGSAIRNETLYPKFNWIHKPGTENLEIVKWIKENLPFEKLNGIHCVSIEPGGFATIHRDCKGLYSKEITGTENRLYNSGYVVITLNISDGGVPLYWSLDGEDAKQHFLSNDHVYLTNDYFMHGVPIVTSRRRQVRVTGIPKPEMWDLFEPETIMSIPDDYKYQTKIIQNNAGVV